MLPPDKLRFIIRSVATAYGNDADMLVFKRAEAIEATEQILIDNSIRQQCSPDIASIWNKRK